MYIYRPVPPFRKANPRHRQQHRKVGAVCMCVTDAHRRTYRQTHRHVNQLMLITEWSQQLRPTTEVTEVAIISSKRYYVEISSQL